jgi:hypothetical protein
LCAALPSLLSTETEPLSPLAVITSTLPEPSTSRTASPATAAAAPLLTVAGFTRRPVPDPRNRITLEPDPTTTSAEPLVFISAISG